MTTRTPFDYQGSTAVTSGYSGGPNFEPVMRYSMVPVGGMLLVLDGINENQRAADPESETLPTRPLIMQAPRAELIPMLTGASASGRIFGKGYKWRYRFFNSITGEASGLSPLPSEGWDLGAQSGADYVGETAYLTVEPSLGRTGQWAGPDKVQLFRNTAQQETTFLMVDEADYDGTSTPILFEDNLTDAELASKEDAALNVNPSYYEGVLTPLAKAYPHPNGRTYYYGIRRSGRYFNASDTADMTEGEHEVDLSFASVDGRKFIGMRWRPLTDSTDAAITDATNYRIVAAGVVSPAASQTIQVKTWEIVDDRDGRLVFQSQPGKPTQIDYEETIGVGRDRDDDVQHIFSWRNVTYAATRRKIIRWDNDTSEAPHLTTRFTVAAEEGQSGLRAGTVTPFGYVFVNERGVRIFDGGDVYALGADSAFGDFPAADQFVRVEMDALDSTLVVYDKDANKLHVSYVRKDGNIPERTLTFDPETGTWRGPNRRSVYAAGTLRNASGEDVFLLGDSYGNLVVDEEQAADVLPDVSTHTISGSITSVLGGNGMVFEDSAATFDPDNDAALTGVPIVFTETDGSIQVNWIARVLSTTKLQLANLPVRALTTGWAYNIGAIRWRADTAYFDAGDAWQPKRSARLRMRFARGSTDTFEVQAAVDGDSFAALDDTSLDASSSIAESAYTHRGGYAFQYRVQGTATAGEPRITKAGAEINVRRGRR